MVCWTAAVTKAWAGGERSWARELAYDLPCMYNQACNAKRYREHLHSGSNVCVMAETVCERWPSVGAKPIRCVRRVGGGSCRRSRCWLSVWGCGVSCGGA